jgi:hypothetical protein
MNKLRCQTTFCPFINGECVGSICKACTAEITIPYEEGGKDGKYTACSLITMSDNLKDVGDMIKDVSEVAETLKDLLSEVKHSNILLSGIDEQVGQ